MASGAEITAGEIARLAGVGRAAVSNWRRRYADFPQAVGGTSASPTFRVADVERWLIANDRMPPQSSAERLWLALQRSTSDPDREIPRLIRALLGGRPTDFDAVALQIVAEMGADTALAVLVDRFAELRGRRGVGNRPTTTESVADLIAELAEPAGKVALDPACGTGVLLTAAVAQGAAAVFGQDADADNVTVAQARLMGATDADVRQGDLLHDAWPDVRADVVVSDLPTSGNWGYDELTTDPRWQYALPPRGESELAWVQHALARLRPGGQAVLLLPPGVAERPTGRRIRRELLRRGALRAVIALPSGATAPYNVRLHIWILQRPDSVERAPDVLMIDADGEWADAITTIRDATTAYDARRPLPSTLTGRAAIIEAVTLSSEDVDLTPSRHVIPHGVSPSVDTVLDSRAALLQMLSGLPSMVPTVHVRGRSAPTPDTTIGDLAKSGLLTIHTDTEMPVQGGDVLVATIGPSPSIDVVASDVPGTALGPQLILIRMEPDRLDPWFIAGFIGLLTNVRRITSVGSIPRIDVRKAQVPRMPIERQRWYGEQFRALRAFDDALQATADAGQALTKMIAEGLAAGSLSSER